MAERLNAAVSKTVLPLIEVTRVQIPPLPPVDAGSLRGAFLIPRGAVFCSHGSMFFSDESMLERLSRAVALLSCGARFITQFASWCLG